MLREVAWKPAQLHDDPDQLPDGQSFRVEPRFEQPLRKGAGLIPPRQELGKAVYLLQ